MDVAILKFLNGSTGRNIYLDAVFIFLAVYFIFVLAGAHFVYFWRAKRLDLWLLSVVVAGIAYFTKIIIGFLHFRFRPFVMDGINKLIDKSSTEASFPSGHTLLAFALAFGVFWADKKIGTLFLIGALLVAISRIIVGVHYPSDIVAGILIAFLLSLIIKKKIESIK